MCKCIERGMLELSNTFCDADDLDKSYEYLENNIPESWDLFFKNLFSSYNKSGHQKRKALTIFQIACYNINNGTIKTPLHISIGQTVHEISRSKQLIQILNRLGICMSYDEIERQNCSLSLRTIHMSGNENVPLPPSIVPGNLVQAAIDNFDHEEGTPSRIGGSHDTIMVVFQNNQHQEKNAMQKSDFNINYTQKKLTCILPCQVLKKYNHTKRAEIPMNFTISERLEISNLVNLRNKDYLL